MPIDEEGKKWSCEPCLRGHRSSKCRHFDRLMIKVPKSGRPLKECPHSRIHCGCRKSYAIVAPLPESAVSKNLCRPVRYVTGNPDELSAATALNSPTSPTSPHDEPFLLPSLPLQTINMPLPIHDTQLSNASMRSVGLQPSESDPFAHFEYPHDTTSPAVPFESPQVPDQVIHPSHNMLHYNDLLETEQFATAVASSQAQDLALQQPMSSPYPQRPAYPTGWVSAPQIQPSEGYFDIPRGQVVTNHSHYYDTNDVDLLLQADPHSPLYTNALGHGIP
ncbi:copper fist DNA binding domain-containing protein [Aspergillus karnatakaensis]|uniref:copper fist DNA-binding domain-containing protein n=1 Tax=Aspergillus karnatakaensis TaxID=1810916 RepID=UPI003CCD9F77